MFSLARDLFSSSASVIRRPRAEPPMPPAKLPSGPANANLKVHQYRQECRFSCTTSGKDWEGGTDDCARGGNRTLDFLRCGLFCVCCCYFFCGCSFFLGCFSCTLNYLWLICCAANLFQYLLSHASAILFSSNLRFVLSDCCLIATCFGHVQAQLSELLKLQSVSVACGLTSSSGLHWH